MTVAEITDRVITFDCCVGDRCGSVEVGPTGGGR